MFKKSSLWLNRFLLFIYSIFSIVQHCTIPIQFNNGVRKNSFLSNQALLSGAYLGGPWCHASPPLGRQYNLISIE